ncbi:signal peptide peptidase SppA [Brumimicrobium aurantiacum]|uniref:Signal peptide peptidase SppA n=1 Tax=Brumimicrobium aurantiacum TaxID=1737063 RepID=A0A3E1F0V7_9FLAO|nr:signal peptide peptidase SppA [Brumimicrobium aurantiacum]RFC55373.1 signal peptide peptidase SppA [Brumimicrobium aurantiacum]
MTNKKVSFWRIFWASLVAGLTIIILIFVLFMGAIGSLMNSKPVYTVKDKTILHLELSGQIDEITRHEMNFGTIGMANQTGLVDLLYGFEKAAKDDRIKGVFIELKGANCGYSTATEIRKAIDRFEEESGKFVVAYHSGEFVSLKQYYIASAASENYGFHSSMFEFLGLGTELMFYKGMFDKLDLEMQVIRGSNNDFKSAVEPYFLTEMSDSSRLQLQTYLNNIWTAVKSDIGEARGIPTEELDRIADSSLIKRVEQAVKYNLLDGVKYRDEVIQLLADKIKIENTDDLNFKGFEKYAKKKFEAQQNVAHTKKANIAVIVAEGAVTVDGDGLASNNITKLLREARKDKDIKTIVFRVNSPGGSALASDEIWREVKLANEEKKVIVSMGDLAASGGYYIAAPASKIFARETTITGSIGVFGVIPYTGKMLENKLGLTFDRVSTNKHSVLSTNKKLTEKEMSLIQKEVDHTYSNFLNIVAEGRNMTVDQVNEVARGRVWTGLDALKVGLVDTLGGINDAIAYAAKDAKIEHPIIRYYPKVEKEAWMEFIEAFEENEEAVKGNMVPEELTNMYNRVKNVEQMTGIQARLPYEIIW